MVTLDPSVFQAEQSQLSQLFLIGEKKLLQFSKHFCGSPLNSFQQCHILSMLGTPDLDAEFQEGSSRAE